MIRIILMLGFGIFLITLAVRSMRANRLKERYALILMLTGLPFIVFAMMPDLILWFEEFLGFGRAALLVFGLAAFTVLVFLKLMSIISVQERKLIRLTQHVALLEEKLHRSSLLPDSSIDTDRSGGDELNVEPSSAE